MIKETIVKLLSYYNIKSNADFDENTYDEIIKMIRESGKDPEEILRCLFDDECKF